MQLDNPAVETLDLPSVLFALSDPARLAIVRQISERAISAQEATCQSVALDMPKSTRSHHLKVLREAGVIYSVARGRDRVMTLRFDDLESRWPGLLTAILAEQPVKV
jgi:DNA-binding transcriptional ArsR family regulator